MAKHRIGEILRQIFVPLDVSPEREEEIINSIAKLVSDWDMELPVVAFGAPIVPLSKVFSYTVLLPLAPWLEMLGVSGFEYVAFFNKQGNAKRLFDKIEELKKAKRGEGW